MILPSDFDYSLPPRLIATQPMEPRDHCRLLTLNRQNAALEHHRFDNLATLLTADDVLIFNQSKVFPARLLGHKDTGGKVELLLLNNTIGRHWHCLCHPGLRKDVQLNFDKNLNARVLDFNRGTGEVEVEFSVNPSELYKILDLIGHIPIPPYINTTASESKLRSDYQTVYAQDLGSAAAPTAGLHFTNELLTKLKDRGVSIEFVTLHVGLGTFKPLESSNLQTSTLHYESYTIDPSVVSRLTVAKKQGKRLVAVGTTTVRTLESYARSGKLSDSTNLFIYPPYKFALTDSLITNFHLPSSSLLMLVTAFASAPNCPDPYLNFTDSALGKAYRTAINDKYRFFSFGDAMWIY